MLDYLFTTAQYGMIILSVAIAVRCLRSMLSGRNDPEIWAYIQAGDDKIPVYHWENIIGRGASADIRVFGRGINRTHAVLKRSDKGIWYVYDVFSRSGVWVNGARVYTFGQALNHGDIINLGGGCVRFLEASKAQRFENEDARTSAGKNVSPVITLFELTLFQIFLLSQHLLISSKQDILYIAASFAVVIVLEWSLYNAMRLIDRKGFEVETLAFYLTTLGLSVCCGKSPSDLPKQILLTIVSVALFLLCGLWLRKLKRTSTFRIPVAIFALLLLALNVLTGSTSYGARNWLTFGGYSFQPSEIVKCAYIYVGAATMEKLYGRRNLFLFIAFSAICVIALALIGDFGTALIFFVTFLVISFMRSGSIATVLLAVTGAGLAGFLAVTVKPYIANRFAVWGHVWEDVYDKGYQQTRAMSALASGGLIGKGAGGGWLKNIFAADTDMVFALIAEELGLIVAVSMVFSVLIMAFFAVRCARNGRSSYYAIAACASVSMLLTQMSLNVFGSLDILPFTGVTFPFVSKGGSSLMSCWMLMAFLKSADNRKEASFAVKSAKKAKSANFEELSPAQLGFDNLDKIELEDYYDEDLEFMDEFEGDGEI